MPVRSRDGGDPVPRPRERAGSSIGTSPRLRPASHWRQKTFGSSPSGVGSCAGSNPSACARHVEKPGSEPIIGAPYASPRAARRPQPSGSVTFPRHGHVHDAVPRVQGVVRRRAGDPGAPARGRSQRGVRRRRRRRHQHVLRHERGGREVPSGGGSGCTHARPRRRHRLRREPLRRRRSPACPTTSG